MPDDTPPTPPPPPGFPYATAATTLLALFLFAGLVWVAYHSPNYLGDVKMGEPKTDPATKLSEVRARNQAVLDGTDPGVKMPVGKAANELLGQAERTRDKDHPFGTLPFPVEPPKQPDAKDKK